jgi:hypothetical protein
MASQLAIHQSSLPSNGAAPSGGESFRVVIRMENVRQNLCRQLGSRPTDSDVLSWLGTLGFVPATDGNAWTCNQDSLRWLADGEIARTERVECAPAEAEQSDGSDRQYLRSVWRDLGGRVQAAVDRITRTTPHS